ncbi:MAG: hypothetical protein P1Q69_00645 [Candidatus Thorarchaeota archaeon]|nr:hypothetical protein [Candidatus Thorarchaeota archaeon]
MLAQLDNRKRWYIVWGITSIVTLFLCYATRPHVSYTDEFAVLLNSVNVISYSIGLGLPFFLAAGISVSSSFARRQAHSMLQSGISPARVFFRRLLEAYILATMFTISSTIVLFIEPIIAGTTFYSPMGTGYLIYLPVVLVSSLAISLILTSIGIFLAVLTDDIILATSVGCAVTIYLATLIGWAPTNLYMSLTRSIAVYSPHNLAKAFAVILSDYEHPSGHSLSTLIGFEPSWGSILYALCSLVCVSLICITTSIKILQHNSEYWDMTSDSAEAEKVWTSRREGFSTDSVKQLALRLRFRRAGLIIAVGFLLVTMSNVAFSYQNAVREGTTITFHQSPDNGEPIHLGEWYSFSCEVQQTQYDQFYNLYYDCSLINWGSAPSEVTYFYKMLNVTSSEFYAENETARRNLCDSRNVTEGDWGGMGGGWNLEYFPGTSFTYVLKIVATDNETLSGVMMFSIHFYQSAGWY